MDQEKWNEIQGVHQAEFTPVASDHRTKTMLKWMEENLIPDKQYTSILEIGFGDGWFMNELKNKFPKAKIVGLSLAQKEVDYAKKKYGIEAFNGDMHEMPFGDEEFDLIIHRDVFEHSVAPYLFLKEMQRVLKQDGDIVFGIPSFEWRNFGTHYSVLSPDQMVHLIHKANLDLQYLRHKCWMFWGMTFGMRGWFYVINKGIPDDWYGWPVEQEHEYEEHHKENNEILAEINNDLEENNYDK